MAEPIQQHELSPSPKTLAWVLAILLGLLALTVGFSFIDFDRILPGRGWGTTIALSIATAKALLVLTYFMHLCYGTRLTSVFASAGFAWLAIMIVMVLAEFLTR